MVVDTVDPSTWEADELGSVCKVRASLVHGVGKREEAEVRTHLRRVQGAWL